MLIDIQIPDWANWIAQDADGEWVAHASEPSVGYSCWNSMRKYQVIAAGKPPADWTKTLQRVER